MLYGTTNCAARWRDRRSFPPIGEPFTPSEFLVPENRSRHHLPVTQDNRGLARIGVDWSATIVAGVLALLAVLDILPKIPW
jgi:hypothetical protein